MKLSTREEYLRRINLLEEYIRNNLDGHLDIKRLAEMSNFSPYHFHRIVKPFLGEPLGAFITRMRVETSARLLRYTNLSIEEIAYRVGYEMPSSLSKMFRQIYNISPFEYRNNKNIHIMKLPEIQDSLKIKGPKIIDLPEKQAIYVRLTGKYSNNDYGLAWKKLWSFVKDKKLYTAGIEHVGISYDDPKVTEGNKCHYDACLVIHKPAHPRGEIGVRKIDGGRYAVFHYQGSYDNLGAVYDWIFGKWLPNSNLILRNAPCLEKYLNNPERTSPEKLKTEIYIPLD